MQCIRSKSMPHSHIVLSSWISNIGYIFYSIPVVLVSIDLSKWTPHFPIFLVKTRSRVNIQPRCHNQLHPLIDTCPPSVFVMSFTRPMCIKTESMHIIEYTESSAVYNDHKMCIFVYWFGFFHQIVKVSFEIWAFELWGRVRVKSQTKFCIKCRKCLLFTMFESIDCMESHL